MVIAAGGHKQDVTGRAPSGHVPRLGDDIKAEHTDVEVAHAIDVGGPQVHVTDAHARVDRVRRRLNWGDVALDHGLTVPSRGLPSPAGSRLAPTMLRSGGLAERPPRKRPLRDAGRRGECYPGSGCGVRVPAA
jgi:hypothetical protein